MTVSTKELYPRASQTAEVFRAPRPLHQVDPSIARDVYMSLFNRGIIAKNKKEPEQTAEQYVKEASVFGDFNLSPNRFALCAYSAGASLAREIMSHEPKSDIDDLGSEARVRAQRVLQNGLQASVADHRSVAQAAYALRLESGKKKPSSPNYQHTFRDLPRGRAIELVGPSINLEDVKSLS